MVKSYFVLQANAVKPAKTRVVIANASRTRSPYPASWYSWGYPVDVCVEKEAVAVEAVAVAAEAEAVAAEAEGGAEAGAEAEAEAEAEASSPRR